MSVSEKKSVRVLSSCLCLCRCFARGCCAFPSCHFVKMNGSTPLPRHLLVLMFVLALALQEMRSFSTPGTRRTSDTMDAHSAGAAKTPSATEALPSSPSSSHTTTSAASTNPSRAGAVTAAAHSPTLSPILKRRSHHLSCTTPTRGDSSLPPFAHSPSPDRWWGRAPFAQHRRGSGVFSPHTVRVRVCMCVCKLAVAWGV